MWTDKQIDDYVDSCFNEMEVKNSEARDNFGLGSFYRFDFDTKKGHIIFSKDDEELRVKVNLICSVDESKETLQWAWANKSLPSHMSAASRELRQLSSKTGLEIFDSEVWKATEDEGWEMAAIALREIGGLAVYRCPLGPSKLFVLLDSVVDDV
ncbi:DUF6882 domain-containing protein [Alteromonas abrolhosensis]|uniref:DUF6882 domain-containing protein n=1 Tax=Alteromonas abrolhosensis TaxID=1892904 RepID=UPI00096B8E84|nr:DUF6882 domain-containing protein [Alteromonas abrolhosensis]